MKKTDEEKRLAKEAKQKAKELAQIEAEKVAPIVKEMKIVVDWKPSRMWGMNPHCEAQVWFENGNYENSPVFKASGCGYCKLSTVVADVFNHYLKNALWKQLDNKDKKPYGVRFNEANKDYPATVSFEGGVGINCYTHGIAEFIGYKMETVHSGKTIDVFRLTKNG
jgi:hypothetical protein